MKPEAFLIVGAGHHARRIYIPELIKNELLADVQIVVVDLYAESPRINDYIIANKYSDRIVAHYLHEHDIKNGAFEDSEVSRKLLDSYNFIGGIISTDPTNHVQYAQWALKHNINILMDKPVSTHASATGDIAAAQAIYDDYTKLIETYEQSRAMFCLSTQRRYETGYTFVNELLSEVVERFNMPITSIQAFHSDGLWIFPDEVLSQKMHPYNTGYGKLSHSGFHILDIVWQLYQHGAVPEKMPDTLETFASATYPQGLIKNFATEDYEHLFGKSAVQHDNVHYLDAMQNFGEIDIFGNFILKRDGIPVTALTVNLLHNSFSKRSWAIPSKDLYKGNGRVKHQSYIIEQGPFQCIQIHNYQATDEHDHEDDNNSYELGGKNHFDIHVFRNSKMFSAKEPTLQKYSSVELDKMYATGSAKLSNEIAKSILIDEFIANCFKISAGKSTRDTVIMRNSITTYGVAVKMMSDMYKSLVLQKLSQNPIVRTAL